MKDERDPSAESPRKREYQAPELTELGRVAELTRGGGGPKADKGFSF